MNKLAVAGASIGILIAGALGVFLLWKFRPVAEKTVREEVLQSVEVRPVSREDVGLTLKSQGVVEALVETRMAAEVAGRVRWVSPAFREGGRFQQGDELLRIEDIEFRARLAEARAALADAELALELEEARRTQAVRDWKKLGSGADAGGLVLREPQVESAAARVEAARAAVETADYNLSQTSIRAPYDGRVRSTSTDLGSYLTVGSPVAEVYSTEALEVRLPVSVDDYAFLAPPAGEGEEGRPVTLKAELTHGAQSWSARLVRVEGEVDRETRSVFLVARLDEAHSFAIGDENVLAPGLFVRAEIPGKTLPGVIRVPRTAAYGPGVVLVVDGENRIRFREVEVARNELRDLIVRSGLESGERICITPLAKATDGMKVQVVESEDPEAGPPPAAVAPLLDARR